jgi:hypothetical protein
MLRASRAAVLDAHSCRSWELVWPLMRESGAELLGLHAAKLYTVLPAQIRVLQNTHILPITIRHDHSLQVPNCKWPRVLTAVKEYFSDVHETRLQRLVHSSFIYQRFISYLCRIWDLRFSRREWRNCSVMTPCWLVGRYKCFGET